ncbi:MAG: SDR family NAD(P)-dependent oxidoreductase [Stenomitos rutilans HA7619-LM2]|jgi:NAD(P)-dependent dehydrogenase (short-subunit alcohol dehydrogenase family)|nr:SDR family NAD(P)-dependent oxidoreductase [Stenomitos rutilans HA7619-LM2]
MSQQNPKVWFITGSSTGFGRSLTEAVLKHGDRVVATARKPEQLDSLIHQYPTTAKVVRLDVTKPQDVREAIKAAIDAFGRIDVVVNNAGFASVGAIEEVSDDTVRRQFETNLFGALDVTRAVLPTLRQQRSGHILNISSVGGLVSFGSLGIYCATKFALEGISEALAKEVAPLGIKVTIVEPGAFRTEINGQGLVIADTRLDDYADSTGGILQWLESMDGKQPGDPDKAATAMIQVVESDNPPLRLALGADAVDTIAAKLESVKAELDAWKQVSLDTAFEGSVVSAIGG